MKRLMMPALAMASSLSLGCNKHPQAPLAVTQAQPHVEVHSACPADAETLPSFTLTADASAADKLAPEVLAAPIRGRCEREHFLLSQDEARPRNASTIETAEGPYLAVYRVHAMAVLPQPKVVLIASETGLWAHDAQTMARLARLAPNRTVDIAATPDGRYFAYVRQDPTRGAVAQGSIATTPISQPSRTVPSGASTAGTASAGSASATVPAGVVAAPRELVVVDTSRLAVVRRIADAPEGRMRISNDGRTVSFARGDDGVKAFDVASGNATSFSTNDTVEDAFMMPDRPGVVAYVGHDNAVAFHDLRSGAEISQSTAGQLPLITNRDLLTVYWEPTSQRLLAGGADNKLHIYQDMLGAHPRDTAQVVLHGNVVDVTCCAEDSIVAATDVVNVAWIKDGVVTREVGPFLPDAASAAARVGLVGNDTIVMMVGRIFTWTRDGFFVIPDSFTGEEVARVGQGTDTLIVLRSRGWLEFHRYGANLGVSGESTLIGRTDWDIIDSTVEAADGSRVFIGRRHGRMVAAFVPTTGDAVFVRGPMVGITGHPVIVARGDGVHFVVWNLDTQLGEVDATAKTMVATQTIDGPRATSVSITWAGDRWKVLDQTGAERTLQAIEHVVTQTEAMQ